jgi:hypothetical protein
MYVPLSTLHFRWHLTDCDRLGLCLLERAASSVTVSIKNGTRIGAIMSHLTSNLHPGRRRNISDSMQAWRQAERPDRLWDPPSFPYNGYPGPFPGWIGAGLEADHSPISSTEIENSCRHASTLLQLLWLVGFLSTFTQKFRSRDSSVGIEMGYGVRFPAVKEISISFRPVLRPTQPPI